jgi:hypothetical protein
MNKRVKTRWLKALRSGQYKQGIGRLKTLNDPDEFCCLGVLCDIALHSTKEGKKFVYEEEATPTVVAYVDDSSGTRKLFDLPPAVAKWAGLDQVDPQVTLSNGDSQHLSWVNDKGFTFEHIADMIEEQL